MLASLAVPLALVVLAALPSDSPGEGDAYIRGIIGVMLVLPLFAGLLAVYHSLVTVTTRFAPVRMPVVAAVLSVVGSAGCAAALMATGAPLTWDRMEDLVPFAAMLWVPLAVGSVAHYFISFRPRRPGAAEPATAGRQHA